jgi:hypothetical protein
MFNFTLLLWAPLALGEEDFHKIKSRETLSRSYKDFNTIDNNVGLSESFFVSTELQAEMNNFCF